MATVDENLRTYLLGSSELTKLVGSRIHENQVPERPVDGYLWIGFQDTEDEYCLDDAAGTGPFRYRYTIECVGFGLRKARSIAIAVHSRLNKVAAKSTFGDSTVQGVFASFAGEDYEPRNDFSDLGFHVRALNVEVVP